MKRILFVTRGGDLDYQNDCLFHGLCCLPETEVFILNETGYDFMFSGLFSSAQLRSLYGRGFTITGLIPPEKKRVHTPEEARKNISEKFYDFVIYGSVFRCTDLLDEVLKSYPRNRIIFIDGEDEDFHFRLTRGVSHRFFQRRKALKYAGLGLYFKRELLPEFKGKFLPVSFAIPEELILQELPENKTREMAFIIPGKPETYIYDTPETYYKGYQESVYGMTFKKGGWDCLRHYEILANGCIPYFPGIEALPPETMFMFPVNLIRYTNMLYEKGITGKRRIEAAQTLLDYTRKYLTTRFIAEYVLEAACR